ncbi:unnamed protein product [Dibothriocephalus latus]|uniref:Uncharacterized protein n=1 Tax=Dibothriocephalus latus TaxID=60516 RepID=A0A3P7M0F3_DIBLA|nr:unnamed protein product [Dibothriocephalus latus]
MEYITSQLSAAYAYFGVPRLASNGRHVFTDVQLISRDEVACEEKEKMPSPSAVSAVAPAGAPESSLGAETENQLEKKKKERPSSSPISLVGTIDCTNDFEPHHEKL